MLKKNYFLLTFFTGFFFLLASICITFPLIFHLGEYATGLGDELLIAWIQSWVVHTLFTNPLALFDANIYFPYHKTLAYSDIFLTTSLLSLIPTYFIGQPIVANNFTLISSLALVGFSVYLLSFYIIKDFLASLLAGLLVIFSPATLSFSVHLQILGVEWVPLSILCFLFFLDSQKTRYFIGSLCCLLLQVYNSFFPAYFILFSWIIIFIFIWFTKKKQLKIFITKKHIFLVLLTILLIIPIALPYFQISQEFHYVRDIRDTIHFALQPEDLLYPGDTTRLKNLLLTTIPTNHYSQNNEFKPGYVGAVFSLLLIYVIYYLIKMKKNHIFIYVFTTIALLGLLLSFGPLLHIGRHTVHKPFPIPLPYYFFYYLIPGFQGFRNSARWEMLFILASAIVISLVLHQRLSKISLKKKIVIYLLLFIGIIGEFNFPMHFVTVPQKKDFPKIYSWMATTPANATFIEMPIYNWNSPSALQQEMMREYYGIENFRKIVNGYSGFSPPEWQQMIAFMHTNFPNDASIQKLQKMGVQYIIVDKSSFDKGYRMNYEKFDGNAIVARLKKNPKIVFVKHVGNYAVFFISEKK